MTTTYVQTVIDELSARLPGNDPELTRLYALLVLTTGTATSLEDVHDARAAWRSHTRPDHPSIVEFDQLDPGIQDLDRQYRDAIRDVAALRFAA